MALWKALASQALVGAVARRSHKGSLGIRIACAACAALCLFTALLFVTLGVFLWVRTLLGTTAAAFVMAGVFLMLALVAALLKRWASQSRRSVIGRVEPSMLAAAFVGGLLGKKESTDRRS